MKKWQILIIGAGPKLVSVDAANEIVADLLEDGQNVKQAVLTVEGGAPEESANLLHERDTKIAEGRDTKIKPRKKSGMVHPKMFEQMKADLEAKLAHSDDEVKMAAGLLEKRNEQLEREKKEAESMVNLQKQVISELEAKLKAATPPPATPPEGQ